MALELAIGPVWVVLGAEKEACLQALADLPLRTAFNPNWSEGMGSSIAHGMAAMEDAEITSAMILLCDQPGVTVNSLRKLHALHQTGNGMITVAQYGGTVGPPVIFPIRYFPELRSLHGPKGAKSLLQGNAEIQKLAMPEAAWDLDLPADLAAWSSHTTSRVSTIR